MLISSKWFNTYHFSTYRMIITDDIEIVLVIVSDDLILFISRDLREIAWCNTGKRRGILERLPVRQIVVVFWFVTNNDAVWDFSRHLHGWKSHNRLDLAGQNYEHLYINLKKRLLFRLQFCFFFSSRKFSLVFRLLWFDAIELK